jgi:hypothetical protein
VNLYCLLSQFLMTNLIRVKWTIINSLTHGVELFLRSCQLWCFSVFYGTRRLITVFTRAHQWSPFWGRSIQFISSNRVSLRSILILSTHLRLGLPSGLFPSEIPTNILYAFLFFFFFFFSSLLLLLLLIILKLYKFPWFLFCFVRLDFF